MQFNWSPRPLMFPLVSERVQTEKYKAPRRTYSHHTSPKLMKTVFNRLTSDDFSRCWCCWRINMWSFQMFIQHWYYWTLSKTFYQPIIIWENAPAVIASTWPGCVQRLFRMNWSCNHPPCFSCTAYVALPLPWQQMVAFPPYTPWEAETWQHSTDLVGNCGRPSAAGVGSSSRDVVDTPHLCLLPVVKVIRDVSILWSYFRCAWKGPTKPLENIINISGRAARI